MQAVQIEVAVGESGKKVSALAVFEPRSKLFWCVYQPRAPLETSVDDWDADLQSGTARLFANRDHMVGFSRIGSLNTSDTGLRMQDSTQHYSSLAEGLSSMLGAIEAGVGDGEDWAELGLPMVGAARWTDIRPQEGGWQITLEIPRLAIRVPYKGIVTVVLGDDYRLLRTNTVYVKQ